MIKDLELVFVLFSFREFIKTETVRILNSNLLILKKLINKLLQYLLNK